MHFPRISLQKKGRKYAKKVEKPQKNEFAKNIFGNKSGELEFFRRKNAHLSLEQFSENDLRIFRSISGSCCCFASGFNIFFASYRSNRQLALFFGKFN